MDGTLKAIQKWFGDVDLRDTQHEPVFDEHGDLIITNKDAPVHAWRSWLPTPQECLPPLDYDADNNQNTPQFSPVEMGLERHLPNATTRNIDDIDIQIMHPIPTKPSKKRPRTPPPSPHEKPNKTKSSPPVVNPPILYQAPDPRTTSTPVTRPLTYADIPYEHDAAYAVQFENLTKQNLNAVLNKYGVATIDNILTEQEIIDAKMATWSTLEYATSNFYNVQNGELNANVIEPINRFRPQSWKHIQYLDPTKEDRMHNHGISHVPYVWQIRMNWKITEVFATLHNTEPYNLLPSFDSVAIRLPNNNGTQSPASATIATDVQYNYNRDSISLIADHPTNFLSPHSANYQAFVTLEPIHDGASTLAFLEASHKSYAEYTTVFKKKEFAKTRPCVTVRSDKQYNYLNQRRQHPLKALTAKPGTLVIFDTRLFHAYIPALTAHARSLPKNCVFLSMTPREWADENACQQRRTAYDRAQVTGHVPHIPRLVPRSSASKTARSSVLPPNTSTKLLPMSPPDAIPGSHLASVIPSLATSLLYSYAAHAHTP